MSSSLKAIAADAAFSSEGLRYADHLQALCKEIRKARSGERTRLRLLACGAVLLESVGFRDLNVEEVCAAAGMAKGTFYIHFKSKDEFLVDMAKRYVDFELSTMLRPNPELSPFRQMRAWIEWYARTFAQNVGVMRCLVQMGEVSPEMRDLWHERNRRQMDQVQIDWLFTRSAAIDPALARLTLRLPGGMLDQSLFERYEIAIGPGREEPDDLNMMIELHALLVYRAIFGRNPDAAELGPTRPLLDWPALS